MSCQLCRGRSILFFMCNEWCFSLPLPKDTSTKNPEELEPQASRLRVFTTELHRTYERVWGQRVVKNHIQLLHHENVCSLFFFPFIGIKISKQALNFSSSYHDMYMVKNGGLISMDQIKLNLSNELK